MRTSMPRSLRMAFLLAAVFGAAAVDATNMADIHWEGGTRASHDFQVEPSKFVELCGPLRKGQAVQWRYESNAPLDFNVHYHVGQKVHYPSRHEGTARADGRLDVTLDESYCWMWTNRSSKAVEVQVRLTR